MNPFSLNNKHILITGASSGIGRQCAISCSQQGARITLVARNKERLQETQRLLPGEGHYSISQDISILESVEQVVKESVLKNGKIDGFIHAAGIEKTLPLKMHKKEVFFDLFTINTLSAFEFARNVTQKKYVSPYSCSIVFISSVMGIRGNGGLVGYSSTKGALIAGTKSLAIELGKKNIRVNSISPGHINNTAMSNSKEQSLPKAAIQEINDAHILGTGEVSDVANACIFLLSEASKWITGTNLIVDGGYSAK
jgi:NAD(P)-dependent dehydrogenase (short-subunit alcohol dehydrogenase family)